MTLRENEQPRRQPRPPKRKLNRRSALQTPVPFLAAESKLQDEQVLSFRQWCALNGFSLRTGRRILASGNGPTVIQMSDKRIGVTVAANRVWQAARSR